MQNCNVRIGTTTNLLYGLNPSWLSAGEGNNALFGVETKAMEATAVDATAAKPGSWGLPTVTLHDTAESLLDTLCPYKVENPNDGLLQPEVGAGTMLMRDADRAEAVKKLSATLGVDLSRENTGFALVQVRRESGAALHCTHQEGMLVHPHLRGIVGGSVGMTSGFLDAARALPKVTPTFCPDEITEEHGRSFLQLFVQQGTHYVSAVELGDVLFQVFSMPADRYARVKRRYSDDSWPLTGSDAILFRQYTTDQTTGAYGYVQEYGPLLTLSGSSKLRDSVAAGEWVENTYALRTSIFAPFQPFERKISQGDLDARFLEVTATKVALAPLTMFIEYRRREVWVRVLKGALLQKYGGTVQPQFVAHRGHCADCNPKALNRNQLPGFLSTIATPQVNVYRTTLDTAELSFVAPEEVQALTLCSNYVHHAGEEVVVSLPGKDVLISAQQLQFSLKGVSPVLEVTDVAYSAGVSIACQTFQGGAVVRNASQTAHFALVDGLRYEAAEGGPQGRSYVAVVGDVRVAPAEAVLGRLKSSLLFSYAFAEGIMASVSSKPTEEERGMEAFVREGLAWLTKVIPEGTTDAELLDVRVRSLDLVHIGRDTTMGAFVPILPVENYTTYLDSILAYVGEIDRTISSYQGQIEARKTQELVVNVGKDLNENIIASGKLLAGYVEASQVQQQALASYYDNVITQKQAEQKQAEASLMSAQSNLEAQRSEVRTAVANLEQAYKDWKITESVKFALTVATDLFSVGTSFFIPASAIKSVETLGLTAQRIQKLLNVLNGTAKLYNDISSGVSAMEAAQSSFAGAEDLLTANLNYDELQVRMLDVLSTMPSSPILNGKKTALMTAFKVMVLRGKAVMSVQATVQQNAKVIYDQQRQKQLMEDQAQRLKQLQTDLNPTQVGDLPRSRIDLVGMTGQLGAVRASMLGMLSRAFTLKDQALQYTYMQPATALTSFDTLGVLAGLLAQEGATVAAKTQLSQHQVSTSTPISVDVEVAVDSIRNGGIYEFDLQPCAPEFLQYVNVRVKSMVVKVDGITGTDGGEYLVSATYVGRPFVDRNVARNVIPYNTLSRKRVYMYAVEGNVPQFSDSGESWSEEVNPVTPFSRWELSLPATSTNKGMTFASLTVRFTLTFVVEGRLVDAPATMLYAAAEEKPSKATLISQMAGKSSLNDWDVVFNMALDKINNVLATQYDQLKNNDKDYGGKIIVDVEDKSTLIGDVEMTPRYKFTMQYGYPKLRFLVNNRDTVDLQMEITSGTIAHGKTYRADNTEENMGFMLFLAKKENLSKEDIKVEDFEGHTSQLVLSFYHEPESIEKPATLQAAVAIEQVRGLVEGKEGKDNTMSVVLDMSKGAFAAKDLEIADTMGSTFSDKVSTYFVHHPVLFIINSLDLTGIATLDDLKPKEFLFKVLKTKKTEEEMLQLFIMTNKRSAWDYSQTYISTDVSDPIPMGSECSLMISSKIFFDKILPGGLSSLSGWSLEGVAPPKDTTGGAWTSSFSKANVSASVDLGQLRGGTPSFRACEDPVTLDLKGMTIAGSKEGTMSMKFEDSITFEYLEKGYRPYTFLPYTVKHATKVKLRVKVDLDTDISEDLKGQQNIGINMKEGGCADIVARTSGGGACGCDDLEAEVNSRLKKQLPPLIKDKLDDVSFPDVSVFALENLLFPSGNHINLQSAHVPGDLLILGNFSTA